MSEQPISTSRGVDACDVPRAWITMSPYTHGPLFDEGSPATHKLAERYFRSPATEKMLRLRTLHKAYERTLSGELQRAPTPIYIPPTADDLVHVERTSDGMMAVIFAVLSVAVFLLGTIINIVVRMLA